MLDFDSLLYHESKWVQSDEMENLVADLKPISQEHSIRDFRKLSFGDQSRIPHKKIGRNEPCPCGSGKKYKRCCIP